ncbi:hypothetical protein [Streptomyces luteogriseus]|uniref:hypothetical protein n=1 Tax=Streptomyces luteogriseus TaxID=68233 RepID=UPI00368B1B69
MFWHARDAGVLDRIVCVHADLGSAEWEGTKELAAEHAAAYGLRCLRFEVVVRNGGDLIERIEERGNRTPVCPGHTDHPGKESVAQRTHITEPPPLNYLSA